MKKSFVFTAAVLIFSFILTGCAATKKVAESAGEKEAVASSTPASEQAAPSQEAPAPEADIPLPEEPTIYEDTATTTPPASQEATSTTADTSDDEVLEPVPLDEGLIVSDTPTTDSAAPDETKQKVAEPAVDKTIPAAEEKTTATEPETVKPTVTKQTTPTTKQTTPATKQTPPVVKQTTPVVKQPATSTGKAVVPSTEPIAIPADEAEPAKSSEESSVVAKDDAVPSRSVTMLNNQYLDVVYPGTGWVYLGETNGSSIMKYFGRKIGTSDTSFSLRSSKPGTTVLHFYKNDILTGAYIDDYLAVTVKDERAATTEHAVAPSYAEYVPPRLLSSSDSSNTTNAADTDTATASPATSADNGTKAKTASTQPVSSASTATASGEDDRNVQTVIQTTESSPADTANTVTTAGTASTKQAASTSGSGSATAPASTATASSLEDTSALSSDDILSLAQKSYDSGKYADTLSYLNASFDKAVTRVDEGLYLQGQALEAKSEVRNIKSALDTYQSLVNDYPQSIDWEKANERITYLKRFYFNIR